MRYGAVVQSLCGARRSPGRCAGSGDGWFDEAGGEPGAAARFVNVGAAGERDAHAPLDEAFGLAEEAQVAARDFERVGDTGKNNRFRLDPAVDYCRGAGCP